MDEAGSYEIYSFGYRFAIAPTHFKVIDTRLAELGRRVRTLSNVQALIMRRTSRRLPADKLARSKHVFARRTAFRRDRYL
jgi:hypothetical protein